MPPVDLVGSLIVWLRTQLTGVDVVAKVPRGHTGKMLLVRRLGGPWQWPVIDQPQVGLEAWAPTQAQAWTLIQDARARVHSLRGGSLNGVAVYDTPELGGPGWLPDPETDEPRYVCTIQVSHRENLPTT